MKRRSLAIVVAVLASVLLVGFLTQQVFFPVWTSRNELYGVGLGATKQEAIEQLAHAGVRSVLPEPDTAIVVNRGNLDQLPLLKESNGICLNDYGGMRNAKFEFDSTGRIINRSQRLPAEFSNAHSRAEVLQQLRTLLVQVPHLEVVSCIPDSGWVSLTNDGGTASVLGRYDVWTLEVPQGYSGAVFRFVGGRLYQIRYRWQFFELP